MISVNRALRSDRLIRATTGLPAPEFKPLVASFNQELQKERRIRYERGVKQGVRERRPGGGRIGTLRTPAEKLFFVLFYYKCYPTFDVLGLLFDLDRSNACRNVQNLASIVENMLGKEMVLPERKISTVEELLELFPDVKDIFIDGTERPIQRPTDRAKQKENYSGKKKPKGGELTDEEKARNKAISGFRVLVEHAIGGLKRFGIATEKCRNKNDEFNDQVMTISCGLWNYHLKRC